MERVSEGAEAIMFEIRLSGEPLLVKARNRKAWRIARIDEELRGKRTKKEAKA
jgi:Mn2+-dependent serine/threonine protein kinase